jgi:hypothetical protein
MRIYKKIIQNIPGGYIERCEEKIMWKLSTHIVNAEITYTIKELKEIKIALEEFIAEYEK